MRISECKVGMTLRAKLPLYPDVSYPKLSVLYIGERLVFVKSSTKNQEWAIDPEYYEEVPPEPVVTKTYENVYEKDFSKRADRTYGRCVGRLFRTFHDGKFHSIEFEKIDNN